MGVFCGPGGLSYVQIGPGIQNFKKILPAYVRTRVYATPCYEQAYLAISLQQKEQCMGLNHSFQMGQKVLASHSDNESIMVWPTSSGVVSDGTVKVILKNMLSSVFNGILSVLVEVINKEDIITKLGAKFIQGKIYLHNKTYILTHIFF